MFTENILYGLGKYAVKAYSHLMFDIDIQHYPNLPDGPKIFVANHPSTTDPFLIPTLTQEKSNMLIHGNLFNIPVFGKYLKHSGHIPVYDDRGAEALVAAQTKLNHGESIVIFIEGAISPLEGGFHRPHTGAARLAISHCVPIIPVGISLHRHRIKFTHSRINNHPEIGTWYFRGPYAATVGHPLYFLGDSNNREYVTQITTRIMASIKELSLQSDSRLSSPSSYTLNSII